MKKVPTVTYAKVCKGGFNAQVKKYLMTYLENGNFFELLDNCKYKLAFKNGIFNMKTMTFDEGITQTDYISKKHLTLITKNLAKKINDWVYHELKRYVNGILHT